MDATGGIMSNFQIGIDIATSVTIIGAFISWIIESRRRQRKEEIYGVSERANATVLKTTQEVLGEFEDRFSAVIDLGQKFEKKVDKRIKWDNDKPFEYIGKVISNDDSFIDQRMDELLNFREEVGNYYEKIQMRRYTLFPLLDALDDGDNFINELMIDVNQIGAVYNKLSSGWGALLREYHDLVVYMEKNNLLDADLSVSDLFSDETVKDALISIIRDKDYMKWTMNFVEDENEEAFEAMLESGKLDADIIVPIMSNILGALSVRPYELYGRILHYSSTEVQNARQECKDILIKLSALMHKLLVKNDEKSLSSIVKLYHSETYFNSSNNIR